MNIRTFLTATLLFASVAVGLRAGEPRNFNIIPAPQSLTEGTGFFTVTSGTRVSAPKAPSVARILSDKLSRATGYNIPVSRKGGKGAISFVINKKIKGDEAYTLTVTPERVRAEASTPHGLWNAAQTFLQLLPPQVESPTTVSGIAWKAPACTINDSPRFAYRGTLIDVCRHFFTIDELKHQIDVLSLYKINNLHLHLTEDQGWRVEIKKYPKLTEVGAWRDTENGRYGGFYTQEQLKDLVQYAADRYINIVPEFEMPGHELAAIASYPWLSCRGEQVKTRSTWGVEPIVMCPGKETTFRFLEDVVDELVKIFPSKYFHIGGDEAPRQEWAKCPLCQHLADSLGLKAEKGRSREAQLQSYIIARMEKYIGRYGKSIIGWDEILSGGLTENAIVMSWRGTKGGIEAAKQHHRVIMSPNVYSYIDHPQLKDYSKQPQTTGSYQVSCSKIYSFEPLIPDQLTEEEQTCILGVQANLWTEHVAFPEHAFFQLLPRLGAMCEVQWCNPDQKDFESFKARLPQLQKLYDKLGVTYCRSVE